jgi:hypothetical protein
MSKRRGVNIRIDHMHSRAICDEIGDRLRDIFRRSTTELPLRLQSLIEQLSEADGEVAPSIVPSFEDMTGVPHCEDTPAYSDLADEIAVSIR